MKLPDIPRSFGRSRNLMSWLFFAADADDRWVRGNISTALQRVPIAAAHSIRLAQRTRITISPFRSFARYFFNATSNGAPVFARISSTLASE